MNGVIDARTWLTVGEVLEWARTELSYPMTPDELMVFGERYDVRIRPRSTTTLPQRVRDMHYSEADTAKLLTALTAHVVRLAERALALALESPEELQQRLEFRQQAKAVNFAAMYGVPRKSISPGFVDLVDGLGVAFDTLAMTVARAVAELAGYFQRVPHPVVVSRGLRAPAGEAQGGHAVLLVALSAPPLQPLADPSPAPRSMGASRGQRDRAQQRVHSARPTPPRSAHGARRPRRSARWAAR